MRGEGQEGPTIPENDFDSWATALRIVMGIIIGLGIIMAVYLFIEHRQAREPAISTEMAPP